MDIHKQPRGSTCDCTFGTTHPSLRDVRGPVTRCQPIPTVAADRPINCNRLISHDDDYRELVIPVIPLEPGPAIPPLAQSALPQNLRGNSCFSKSRKLAGTVALCHSNCTSPSQHKTPLGVTREGHTVGFGKGCSGRTSLTESDGCSLSESLSLLTTTSDSFGKSNTVGLRGRGKQASGHCLISNSSTNLPMLGEGEGRGVGMCTALCTGAKPTEIPFQGPTSVMVLITSPQRRLCFEHALLF